MTPVSVRLFATGLCLVSITSRTSRDVSASEGGRCTIATKGDSATARACAKGGRADAKKVMKEMVKQAKANGERFACDSCHKDLDNYELTKNATEDFKKLEAAAPTRLGS